MSGYIIYKIRYSYSESSAVITSRVEFFFLQGVWTEENGEEGVEGGMEYVESAPHVMIS